MRKRQKKMRILETIFKVVVWSAAFVIIAGATFAFCYFGYSIIDSLNEPEHKHLEPLPQTGGFKLEPCLENEQERVVIQELIESKRLCEEALGIYKQIEKVREQLEGEVR